MNTNIRRLPAVLEKAASQAVATGAYGKAAS